MLKKYGFTLAEVLITLAIIGVVAALTIPTLMANYQKTQYIAQLKQTYSQLSQAMKLMMADEGINKVSETNTITDLEEDTDAATLRLGTFLKKYFKVVKDCGIENPSPCFADDSKSLDGSTIGNPGNGGYSVIIANGSSINMQPAGQFGTGGIKVDINGLKKPNTGGRDIFSFAFYYDGSLDVANPECRKNGGSSPCGGYNTAQEKREGRFNDSCASGNPYGSGCFDKILNDNWKMDY